MPGYFSKKQHLGVDPVDVRFLEINAKPWTDKRRITIRVRILPFNQAPSMEFLIIENQDKVVSEVIIVETQDKEIEFTMHVPEIKCEDLLTLQATIKYDEFGIVDKRSITFDL